PGVAEYPGEMRLPVERRRAAPLRGAGMLDPGRPLPPVAGRLVVAEELEQFDAERAVDYPPLEGGGGRNLRRRADHRFLASELLLAQEDVKSRPDDDGSTDKGR